MRRVANIVISAPQFSIRPRHKVDVSQFYWCSYKCYGREMGARVKLCYSAWKAAAKDRCEESVPRNAVCTKMGRGNGVLC